MHLGALYVLNKPTIKLATDAVVLPTDYRSRTTS